MRDRASVLFGRSTSALESAYGFAAEALDALASLAKRGLNPVTALLGGLQVEEWTHYPEGDARDQFSRAQYYYHVHSADELVDEEHGHFHVFLGSLDDASDAPPSHIVGLAMDSSGRLLRLFTTNAWVTGESWRDAVSISAALQEFCVSGDPDRLDLDRWISAMIRLFEPEIEHLLVERDIRVNELLARTPDADVLEDRSIRVLSETRIDLLEHIRAIETALDRAEMHR